MSQYWLMKSEPETFSFLDLKRRKKSLWDGVRNYQARNFMMQEMQLNDVVLFYHSSCAEPGIQGLARVSKQAVPDPSQFDSRSPYYDPKANLDRPIWFCVEVEFVEEWPRPVTLKTIRETKGLEEMLLLKRGQRLSIQPVEERHFLIIQKLSQKNL